MMEAAAKTIFSAGLEAVKPGNLLHHALELQKCAGEDGETVLDLVTAVPSIDGAPAHLRINPRRTLWLLGFGKAVLPMATHLHALLCTEIPNIKGHLNVPAGTAIPADMDNVQIVACGANNLPDDGSVAATDQLLQTMHAIHPEDAVVLLISGGGSALLVRPSTGITLPDYAATVKALANNGADIHELNCVRKHMSDVKGGRLARALPTGSRVLALVVSDVVGDDLSTIACGPTVPDDTTFADAWAVIERFQLQELLPVSVVAHMRKGLCGEEPDSPGSDDACFRSRCIAHVLIGTNATALDACQHTAEKFEQYAVIRLPAPITGFVSDVAQHLVSQIPSWTQRTKYACVLAGGETVVKVNGAGRGGRNQELAMHVARHLHLQNTSSPSSSSSSSPRVVFLSGGTDGQDGPTPAAGAVADTHSWEGGQAQGLEPDKLLQNNDSHAFWSQLDQGQHLLTPGLTGTNVMDIIVLIVAPQECTRDT
ncbi:hypothetical protein PTSG_02380 [Salpingoeca rosetta]|uniref:Glycerate kinase n=1 Tax=Salpingoeca rosetta (strain ATCC 50818 / BSB-021) TaxID=946362 RepID=F2U214_SALR5|nr:uncharacterized protein PTSG_02380 [Salpingoeca rosetta]EGD81666.1 hypothetical protein PTSG_02380 [Salpingoeca rosetta]|eukprot:XP_004996870.1 hypothetical protein PTSG_02380 [Salpingoeca rosetta]